MSYKPEFKGWNELSFEDILIAYRKAKVDVFFERVLPTSEKFAKFEENLTRNLFTLLEKLKSLKEDDKIHQIFDNNNKNILDVSFDDDIEYLYNEDYLLGKCVLIPKDMTFKPKDDNGHIYYSDPKRAFEHLEKTHDSATAFRIIGDFPVETHIISALWINMIGHKFDALLSENIYGSRLKRIKNDETDEESKKIFHISAIGSFEQYFSPYQKWRQNGLDAIRDNLQKERSVIAASLDLKNYYHSIDPLFLKEEKGFQEQIGIELNEHEKDFTEKLADFLSEWSKKAGEFGKTFCSEKKTDITGGIPIGLSVSRILSNILLWKFDKLIEENVTPIYYGRYVDDIFIVMYDNKRIFDTKTFMEFLQERLGYINKKDKKRKFILELIKDNSIKNDFFCKIKNDFCIKSNDNNEWKLNFGSEYQKDSTIQLQNKKQKIFLLDGKAGLDLIDSIEREIIELSSERRLLPVPDMLQDTISAKVLVTAGITGETINTLRKADGLSIRRLGWSLYSRHIETLAHDIPKNDPTWKEKRKEFYDFAYNHILKADKIFEHYSYLSRLLGFAINLEDWYDAKIIIHKSFEAYEKLESIYLPEDKKTSKKKFNYKNTIKINGKEIKLLPDEQKKLLNNNKKLSDKQKKILEDAVSTIWKEPKKTLSKNFSETILRYFPIDKIDDVNANAKAISLLKTISRLEKTQQDKSIEILKKSVILLLKTDLAKTAYKECMPKYEKVIYKIEEELQNNIIYNLKEGILSIDVLTNFLEKTREQRLPNAFKEFSEKTQEEVSPDFVENLLPSFFPTRPYRPEEISELCPECINEETNSSKENSPKNYSLEDYVKVLRGVAINKKNSVQEKLPEVLIAISNIKTEGKSWEGSVCGKPVLTLDRYQQIATVINDVIRLNPRPHYFILPELSIPLEWIDSITNRLISSKINLIAGTEYKHSDNNKIHSEAFLALQDNRLGYPSFIKKCQPKLQPAISEEEDLKKRFGKDWKEFTQEKSKKPVYNHNGFHFGIMVCSELQNTQERIKFQGEVDALMILSWNKDIETFGSLIESSALDIHAYIISVNNRAYADSCVRSPAKEQYKRDLIRLKGGENDFSAVVKLELDTLRQFQSRATRYIEEKDPFKPVPEGYKIVSTRKKTPPK